MYWIVCVTECRLCHVLKKKIHCVRVCMCTLVGRRCLGTPNLSLPPNLKYLLLFHINLFSELSDAVPSFDAQQQAHPFYEGVTDVQMFLSLICPNHVRLK